MGEDRALKQNYLRSCGEISNSFSATPSSSFAPSQCQTSKINMADDKLPDDFEEQRKLAESYEPENEVRQLDEAKHA